MSCPLWQANQGIIRMSTHDAFGRVGDHIPRGETGVAPFLSLGDVITDGGNSKRKTDHVSGLTSLCNYFREIVSMHVTEVAIQEWHANPDLGLVEILIRKA